MRFAVWLLLATTAPVLAQGVFFDDFDYAVQPTAERVDTPGSLFGANPWLEGQPGGELHLSEPTRAWYAYLWSENRGWYDYRHNGADRSWFDPAGAYLSTVEQPGFAVFRLATGTYTEQDRHGGGGGPWITSGLTTRTGTWAARVRLPSFQGLRNIRGGSEALTVVPAPIWAQASHNFVDTVRAHNWNTSNRVWSEVNFEIANWTDPARPNPPHRSIAVGVSWAPYFSNLNRSPVLGNADANGRVIHDGCRIGTASRRTQACFDALTESNEFYTFVHTVDSLTVRSTIVDDAGRVFMQSETLRSAVPSQPMRAVLDLAYFIGTDTSRVETVTMRIARTMTADWVLVLPGQTPDPRGVPALVADARATLRRSGTGATRLNTTGRLLAAPIRAGFSSCVGTDWVVPTLPFDVRVRRYETLGATHLALHLTDRAVDRASGTALRQQDLNISWQAEHLDASGHVTDRVAVAEQGPTLRVPLRRGGRWRVRVAASTISQNWQTGRVAKCSDTGPDTVVRTFDLLDLQ
ncbi:MAG: hypothetical protein IAE99_04210 [Rhodothermales bacterium]|nr:hypothetical protein [Rhodothermales bacterium]